jgi:glycosyltransferase involved in cell wall biosynthesis
VFLGPFRESSGVEVLLDAIDLLPEFGTRRFVFAGGGDVRVEASVRALAASRGDVYAELSRVPRERLDATLRRARLVVLPYLSDAVPADRLLDAYRHHVPLVATAVGASGEMVRADGTGWIVPPADPHVLARALDEARRDDLAVARFSGAIDTALDRYEPTVIGAQLRRALSAPRLV